MQLNEIVEENTLPTISRRTRISVENLDAVLHRDWSRLKKVQALGFISILEREYQVDLSDLKADCRAYFAEVGSPEEAESLVVTPMEEKHSGNYLRIAVLILLLIAVYGGWRFLSVPMSGENNTTSSIPAKKAGSFFDSVLSMTDGWFTEKNRSNREWKIAGEEPPVVAGAWAEENGSEKNRTPQNPKQASQSSSAEGGSAVIDNNAGESEEAVNKEREEAKIITRIKKEQARAEKLRRQTIQETEIPSTEENLSDVSRMILVATAVSDGADPKEEALEPTVPSMDRESGTEKKTKKKIEEGSAAREAVDETAASRALSVEVSEVVVQQQPAVTDTLLVVFHPRSKVWVGYTDLMTMQRVTKVTTDDITFDTSRGDYVLATGHGMVEFKGKNTLKLNDGFRHFFKIAGGEVLEISHEEFQRLNKSKVW